MTEMTSFPVGPSSTTETPVEGQPLLASDALITDDMGRSPLNSALTSLGRDFYCKCVCDPLIKLKYTVPLSAVKLCLLCLAATIVLVSLTMLEIVGAHRQGELQHALKERLKYHNLSKTKSHHSTHHINKNQYSHHKYPGHVDTLRQYGHSLLNTLRLSADTEPANTTAPTQVINLTNNTTNTRNDTSYTDDMIKAVGADKLADTLLNHIETVSNVSKKIANHVKGAFT